MTHHYHLAVTTTDANLSRAVKQLNGDYARWWNWRHRHVGHVFQAPTAASPPASRTESIFAAVWLPDTREDSCQGKAG